MSWEEENAEAEDEEVQRAAEESAGVFVEIAYHPTYTLYKL